ncbi:unnamed protein product [Bursaphelenchus xylophilus]|uniref:(pine wood nematode) hypothetical protein n=1 Tax=Bursaphelenchus xylophilus TaxID=6326 RepID=A0A1I7RUY6_BURXY|nr:unnamed protein product [Bursaphelenchus xylophilus]CAG9105301.1 unnamed protein product [Bursaphelenchus xylophilus]
MFIYFAILPVLLALSPGSHDPESLDPIQGFRILFKKCDQLKKFVPADAAQADLWFFWTVNAALSVNKFRVDLHSGDVISKTVATHDPPAPSSPSAIWNHDLTNFGYYVQLEHQAFKWDEPPAPRLDMGTTTGTYYGFATEDYVYTQVVREDGARKFARWKVDLSGEIEIIGDASPEDHVLFLQHESGLMYYLTDNECLQADDLVELSDGYELFTACDTTKGMFTRSDLNKWYSMSAFAWLTRGCDSPIWSIYWAHVFVKIRFLPRDTPAVEPITRYTASAGTTINTTEPAAVNATTTHDTNASAMPTTVLAETSSLSPEEPVLGNTTIYFIVGLSVGVLCLLFIVSSAFALVKKRRKKKKTRTPRKPKIQAQKCSVTNDSTTDTVEKGLKTASGEIKSSRNKFSSAETVEKSDDLKEAKTQTKAVTKTRSKRSKSKRSTTGNQQSFKTFTGSIDENLFPKTDAKDNHTKDSTANILLSPEIEKIFDQNEVEGVEAELPEKPLDRPPEPREGLFCTFGKIGVTIPAKTFDKTFGEFEVEMGGELCTVQFEDVKSELNRIEAMAAVMKQAKKNQKNGTIPDFIDTIQLKDLNCRLLVLKKLGPSIEKQVLSGTLSTEEKLKLVSLTFNCMEDLLFSNIVHRDIKPSSFHYDFVGAKVLISNLGLARITPKTPRLKLPFFGNLVFCSLSTHLNLERTHFDDMISYFYVVMWIFNKDLLIWSSDNDKTVVYQLKSDMLEGNVFEERVEKFIQDKKIIDFLGHLFRLILKLPTKRPSYRRIKELIEKSS